MPLSLAHLVVRPALRDDFSLQQLLSVLLDLRSSRHSGYRPLQLLRVSMNNTSPLLVLILAVLPATLSHAGTPAPALATSAYVPAVADTSGSSAAILQQTRILRFRPELLQGVLPIWRCQDPMSATHVSLGLELMQAAKKLNHGSDIIAITTQLRPLPMPPLQRLQLLAMLASYIDEEHDLAKLHEMESDISRLALQLPERRDDIADLWAQLAGAYSTLNVLSDSLRLANKAMATAAGRPSVGVYRAWLVISIAYMHQGKIAEAIDALRAAQKVSVALHMPDDALLLTSLGVLYIYAGQDQQAIAYTQHALALDESALIRKHLHRSELLNNLGSAYSELRQFDQATDYFRQAIQVAKESGYSYGYPLNNLGEVLLKHSPPEQALPVFREAMGIFLQQGDTLARATAWSNIGRSLADMGRHDDAAKAFDQGLALFAKTTDIEEPLKMYPHMIANLQALHRYRAALQVMQAYKKASDQRNSIQNQTHVAQLKSVIDMEQQKRKLAEAEQEHVKQIATIEAYSLRNQHQRQWAGCRDRHAAERACLRRTGVQAKPDPSPPQS